MAYSFPVFRKGMIFKTEQLVSVLEARKIATQIKKEYKLYHAAFKRAVEQGNGASAFRTNPRETIKQHIRESHILNFPSMSFRLNGYSVESRNSVTVCMHEHQSKIWTRLTCAKANGKPATNLSVSEVRHFFALASAKADAILAALAETYSDHVRQAGIAAPRSGNYFFQLRAFNSNNSSSEELLSELRQGLSFSKALADKKSTQELADYFAVVLQKRISPVEIKKAIKAGTLDVFGYNSVRHEAIFTASITDKQTDICGYAYDDKAKLSSSIFSHAATKDLLKEYAQHF